MNRHPVTTSGNIIPFPSIHHILHQTPLYQKGDAVLIRAPHGDVGGIVMDFGMVSVLRGERTNAVACYDGVQRVVYQSSIIGAARGGKVIRMATANYVPNYTEDTYQ